MKNKKSISLGFRGSILTIVVAFTYAAWAAFGNFPQNVVGPAYEGMYGWKPALISTVYSLATVLTVIIQLFFARKIANGRVKRTTLILSTFAMVFAFISITITNQALFLVVLVLFRIFADLWATLTNGVLVGQWFPTRKGTVMGISTLAFPLVSGFGVAIFAKLFDSKGIMVAYLPFLIMGIIAIILTAVFLADYPEQVGAYRDNDRSMTPEHAKKMLQAEMNAKQKSVWKGKNIFTCRDFWFLVIPEGLLLFTSVGIMVQVVGILSSFGANFFAEKGILILSMISIIACIGSWVLGMFDTRFGTKWAMVIAGVCMLLAGIFGFVGTITSTIIAFIFVAIFMGASSNFSVSLSAEYWDRADFPSVFSNVNPVVNLIGAFGPAIIAIISASIGVHISFLMIAVLGVISTILPILVSKERIQERGKIYIQREEENEKSLENLEL